MPPSCNISDLKGVFWYDSNNMIEIYKDMLWIQLELEYD